MRWAMPGDHIDVEHYCVHFYNDHLDIHAVHDDYHLAAHRRLTTDEHRAFVCDVVDRAIHDDPALVLDCIDDDPDFLRALDKRRDAHDGPHGYPGGAAT